MLYSQIRKFMKKKVIEARASGKATDTPPEDGDLEEESSEDNEIVVDLDELDSEELDEEEDLDDVDLEDEELDDVAEDGEDWEQYDANFGLEKGEEYSSFSLLSEASSVDESSDAG